MDIDIRERLKEEMTKCNSFRLFKNRVRKCNNILSNDVVENILSFISCGCKKCIVTGKVVECISPYERELYDKWKGIDIKEICCSDEYEKYLYDNLILWSLCFEQLNTFPTKKTFFRRFQNAIDCDYNNCNFLSRVYSFDESWIYHKREFGFKKPIYREFMTWFLCERGCRFYPEVFNEKFQREVICYMFD